MWQVSGHTSELVHQESLVRALIVTGWELFLREHSSGKGETRRQGGKEMLLVLTQLEK